MPEESGRTKTLGEHIARRRRELGLTQEELAALLHSSARTVRDWERGHSLPAPENHRLLELAMNWVTYVNEVVDGWEPWNATSLHFQIRLPRAARKAPPGREEVWRRAQEKKELFYESPDPSPSSKSTSARLM